MNKKYTVYLYRSKNCIRGWIAYLRLDASPWYTLRVEIEAENGSKAKNKAITLANKGLDNLKITGRSLCKGWSSIDKFPEIEKYIRANTNLTLLEK